MNSECVLVNSECVLVLAVNHLSTIMAFGPCCRRFGILAVVSEELVCCSQPFVYRFDIWLIVCGVRRPISICVYRGRTEVSYVVPWVSITHGVLAVLDVVARLVT